jgi:hypothetical protein
MIGAGDMRRDHHSSVLRKATSLVCRSLKIYLLKYIKKIL